MSAELKAKLQQGEAAALHAATQYVKHTHFAREWLEEWELIASRNQAIRDALREPVLMAPPVNFSIVEDSDDRPEEGQQPASILPAGSGRENDGGRGQDSYVETCV